MSQRQHRIEITLPLDFLELCDSDMVSPKKVLCDFIADLCDITSQHPEHSKEYLSNSTQSCFSHICISEMSRDFFCRQGIISSPNGDHIYSLFDLLF